MTATTTGNPYGELASLLGLSVTPGLSVPPGAKAKWIQLPDFQGTNIIPIPHAPIPPATSGFKLITQRYTEEISFQAGIQPSQPGTAPNHGLSCTPEESLQTVGALAYQLFVNNADGGAQLHFENGMWLQLPAPNPSLPSFQKTQIARLLTVPHGDSGLAVGVEPKVHDGPPVIPEISAIPTELDGTPLSLEDPRIGGSSGPYSRIDLNPNKTLQEAIEFIGKPHKIDGKTTPPFTITKTTTLNVATPPNGGISNTPFTECNVRPHSFKCTYWVAELNADGFIWIMYSQQLNLVFADLVWPHIDVNIVTLDPT